MIFLNDHIFRPGSYIQPVEFNIGGCIEQSTEVVEVRPKYKRSTKIFAMIAIFIIALFYLTIVINILT